MTTHKPPAAPESPQDELPADRAGGTHAPRPVTYIDGWEFPLPRGWSK